MTNLEMVAMLHNNSERGIKFAIAQYIWEESWIGHKKKPNKNELTLFEGMCNKAFYMWLHEKDENYTFDTACREVIEESESDFHDLYRYV